MKSITSDTRKVPEGSAFTACLLLSNGPRACSSFIAAAIVLFAMFFATAASAHDGDVFAAGTVYNAATYTNHFSFYGHKDDLDVVDINVGSPSDDCDMPIYAPENGNVSIRYRDGNVDRGFGNAIVFSSSSGSLFLAHLQSFAATGSVSGGEIIGYVGDTGGNYSCHLHVEPSKGPLRLSGVDVIPSFVYNGPAFTSVGPISRAPNGSWEFCNPDESGPCNTGQGDCDGDSQCMAGLVCGRDNGPDFGFSTRIDVCVAPPTPVDSTGAQPGDWDFCKPNESGPCGVGEGDCDGDRQCQSTLVCASNKGRDYGWKRSVDVCEAPISPGVPDGLPLGHANFCKDGEFGPCDVGQGDCDGDRQCRSGLVCSSDVGLNYGMESWTDVCELPAESGGSSGLPLGHVDYCKPDESGPCGEGQGDCDGDRQCRGSLVCSSNVGKNYGFKSSTDVCESPASLDGGNGSADGVSNGDFAFCKPGESGPCSEGQGDCDGDKQCKSGLVCVSNVGRDYGWKQSVDVCEAP